MPPSPPRFRRFVVLGCAGLALLLLCVATPSGASAEGFESAKRKYKAYLQRPSLFMRTRGRTRFAATGEIEALRMLMSDYGRPEEPKERVRYLIASAAARGCRHAKHLPVYAAWRAKHFGAADAWLWYRAGQIEARAGAEDAILAATRKAPNSWVRAAAIHALAGNSQTGLLAKLPGMIEKLPSNKDERGVVAQAAARALLARKGAKARDEFAPAAKAVIALLDDRRIPLRSKLVVARHLQALFDTADVLGVNSAPWLLELKAGGGTGGGHDDRYGVSFNGIKAAGDRICYVIDASDSMLKPLSGAEKRKARGPITGEGAGRGDDIPWDEIGNRFDLARALLIQSLRRLKPDKQFSVILFGSKAGPLASTNGLVAAKPKKIEQVIEELEAIEPGPTRQNRPHGVLRGSTNLHGAFDRAFRVKSKGMHTKKPYVSAKMLQAGCDTIFLFSDGRPSTDDYMTVDKRDPGDHAGDPEANTRVKNTPNLNYFGPYVGMDVNYLVDDIERMNLFRAAEIHCVGIGEADMALLRQIARVGLGTVKRIGAAPKKK